MSETCLSLSLYTALNSDLNLLVWAIICQICIQLQCSTSVSVHVTQTWPYTIWQASWIYSICITWITWCRRCSFIWRISRKTAAESHKDGFLGVVGGIHEHAHNLDNVSLNAQLHYIKKVTTYFLCVPDTTKKTWPRNRWNCHWCFVESLQTEWWTPWHDVNIQIGKHPLIRIHHVASRFVFSWLYLV